ncbi:MAG: LysE type translocator [Bacteroidota bacterium]
MVDSIFNIVIFGFLTGFLFSIPAAGPIMILIASNGLKGKLRFCERVTYGAALSDLVYSFVGVFAFARLYDLYSPYIPYILGAGSLFLIALSVKIIRTKLDFEHMDDSVILNDKLRNKGGFRIGLAVNFLNPGLFIGWMASSFIMLSLAGALGLNTGGLSMQIEHSLQEIGHNNLRTELQQKTKAIDSVILHLDKAGVATDTTDADNESPNIFWLSFIFATTLAIGSTTWFYFLANLIVNHRHRLNMKTIQITIKILGFGMLAGGIYFVLKSGYAILQLVMNI